VAPDLAWNTAASFTTNTNWQDVHAGNDDELPDADGRLAYHNFASAAVGIALAIAIIREWRAASRKTIGKLLVDLTRCCSGCCCQRAS